MRMRGGEKRPPLRPADMSADIPRNTSPENSNRALWVIVMGVFLVVAAGGAAALYLLGSHWDAPATVRNMGNPVARTEANVSAGMQTYRERCAKCHGDGGDGKGEKAGDLSVSPTDFTSASEMKGATDGELFWKISVGHRPMPAYKGKLSEEERWQVVRYIRTFARAKLSSSVPSKPPK
jgi:mono/diheme cytochrome c family protein